MARLLGYGIELLEAMFVIGSIGSALVLVLSGIEDTYTIFEKDEPTPKADGQE